MQKIEASDEATVIVQGFRGGEGLIGPYVLLAIGEADGGWSELSIQVTSRQSPTRHRHW